MVSKALVQNHKIQIKNPLFRKKVMTKSTRVYPEELEVTVSESVFHPKNINSNTNTENIAVPIRIKSSNENKIREKRHSFWLNFHNVQLEGEFTGFVLSRERNFLMVFHPHFIAIFTKMYKL
jgi:hypothetical protein